MIRPRGLPESHTASSVPVQTEVVAVLDLGDTCGSVVGGKVGCAAALVVDDIVKGHLVLACQQWCGVR